MPKKKSSIEISFVNEPAAEVVTGSMVHIKTEQHNILLDAGFYQSADIVEDYRINNRTLKSLKMKDIDYIILSHNHGDHIFYTPVLFKRNCKAKVLVPAQSSAIMKAMLEDCAHINEKDAAYLSIREGREYFPLYTNGDVGHFMNFVHECPTHTKIQLDDELAVEFIPSGHLLKGCQIVLHIKVGGQIKKILYTGDLGNKYLRQPFTEKFEPVNKANIVIAESTYSASKDLRVTQKERDMDMHKITRLVEEQVIRDKGRLLIPVFAQARAETVLYLLYRLYGNKPDFKTKIYIDSPLACKIFKIYPSLLDGRDKEIFNRMIKWENVRFITEAKDSIDLVASDEPCVILSSSGMCTNGRVKYHLKSLIGNPNATILFTGYSTEGSLAYHLKNGDSSVVICGEEYVVRCKVECLQSLSSHIPYFAMLEYYSNIHCNKLILHHGNMDGKKQLKADLDDLFAQKYLTTKVIVADKDTIIEM
jgi:metallo-beta-lactamase family protein